MTVSIVHDDCRTAMRAMAAGSVDAIVTDPPYGLGFMGKEWDHGVPGVEFWTEALRVAKPGAHLVAFGGTRTWHRLAVAIEDAGWEVRDTLAWMYGQGFPKSLDVSKAIDAAAGAEREVVGRSRRHVSGSANQRTAGLNGSTTFAESIGMGAYATAPATDAARQWSGWGTALKPAHEPVILARKPLIGTVAANVLAHGAGGINVDGCRIEGTKDVPWSTGARNLADLGVGWGLRAKGDTSGRDPSVGRWPANVVLDEEAAALLDEQTGTLTSGKAVVGSGSGVPVDKQQVYAGPHGGVVKSCFADSGGASRFFYVAKASRSERTHGGKVENTHPTVKPLALMRWLVRLVTPPGGRVLDPFAGSGTTAVACVEEGLSCIGIERDEDSAATARARVEAAAGLFAEAAE